jgi:hypothetical protein
MRNLKELLKITLKKGNLLFKKGIPHDDLYYNGFIGLCGFVNYLKYSETITFDEYISLIDFITENKPKFDSPHYATNQKHMGYFWKEGQWNPRKKWLEEQIKNIKT